jgi:hypothetical protein
MVEARHAAGCIYRSGLSYDEPLWQSWLWRGARVESASPRLWATWRLNSPLWDAASRSSMPIRNIAWWPGPNRATACLSRAVEKVAAAGTLRARARKAEEDTDIVLIDTPPGHARGGLPGGAGRRSDAAALRPVSARPVRSQRSSVDGAESARRTPLEKAAHPLRAVQGPDVHQPQPRAGFLAQGMGKKVLPAIGQRVVVAEAVSQGLTVAEFAPDSPARAEFSALAKAVDKILRK